MHLAGAVAINVDQQAKSGNTDSQIQLLSIIFIIGLLLLVFRAALAPFVTLIPAVLAVTISGPLVAEAAQHGLKVSPLAQILLIVLVLVRARTTACSWSSGCARTCARAWTGGRR